VTRGDVYALFIVLGGIGALIALASVTVSTKLDNVRDAIVIQSGKIVRACEGAP
jgi:hypothetical protein